MIKNYIEVYARFLFFKKINYTDGYNIKVYYNTQIEDRTRLLYLEWFYSDITEQYTVAPIELMCNFSKQYNKKLFNTIRHNLKILHDNYFGDFYIKYNSRIKLSLQVFHDERII